MPTGTEVEGLVFESEEARAKAIDALDERDPANEGKLDAIMAAKIKESAAPTEPENAAAPEKKEEAKPVETPTPAPSTDETFTLSRKELEAIGFDSPGKLLKSYGEAQATIERSQKFIKEKLSGTQDESTQAAIRRSQELEAENKALKAKYEAAAEKKTEKKDLPPIPESKIGRIREVRKRLQELSADPVTNDVDIHKLRLELDDLWIEENERSNLMVQRTISQAEAAEARAQKAESTAGSIATRTADVEKSEQAKQALLGEFKQIDEFASNPKYADFKMSKSAPDVEREYLAWGKDVAALFYGSSVNTDTPDGLKAMREALRMLQRGAPDITDKCKAAGTPTIPPDDVRKYLEICDLLDYRDGYRTDPITGQKEIVKRFHAPSGSYIPDAFPSLSAAYEDRMVRDGVYEKKIREAFSKGGQAMAEAAARRSSAAAEMGNAGGASPRDAGLKMSPEQAREIIDTVDEVAAIRLKRSGDPSLLRKLNEAMTTLGMDPVDE